MRLMAELPEPRSCAMALGTLPETNLETLIQSHLASGEDLVTGALIERIRDASGRGYLTRGEFREVCRWKSPRSAGRVAANNHHRIRTATEAALSDATDHERI